MPHGRNHRCTGWRNGLRCGHPRQVWPLNAGAFMLCAWPGCSEGTTRHSIRVRIEQRSFIAPARVVQFDREGAGCGGPPYRWTEICS
jgi:hypothetical protein